ncbi:MAG: peptidylprolyl isomerase [Bacillota bacterium]|nr:peptidylprolyl isomerase [Bacillota bacterium]
MTKAKRLLIALAMVLALVLTGCGGQGAATTEATETTASSSELSKEALEKAVVIVDQSYIDNDTFVAYYKMQLKAYNQMYGEEIAEREINGIKFSEILKKNMADDFANDLAIVNYIRSTGTIISKEEVEKEFQDFLKQSQSTGGFEKAKTEFGIDEDFVRKEIERSLYIAKFEEMLRQEVEADQKALNDLYTNRIVQVKARHILVKTEEEAKKIIEEIKEGKSFSDAATEYSQDPGSAQNGGDLGYFSRGVMVPTFEAMAFSLKIGDISDPVQSDFGFHIIQVEDTRTVQQMKDAGVAELEIEKQETSIKGELVNSAYFKRVEEILNKSKVEIHTERAE